tara:strand:- start:232 stop:945 length:714 start_codon:yes stop_codon:yes gene_type:complete
MAWKEAALKHAKKEMPKEACGLVCINKGREKYWPCRNAADFPSEGFLLHPDDWMKCEDMHEIVAVFHSHPGESPQPSQVDKASCEYIDLPFYICNPETEAWHYFEPSGYKAPLIGRTFCWGSQDCWSLIIDYFAEKGLTVKDWKRPGLPEEILTNNIFCENNFIESGFVPLAKDAEWKIGDVLSFAFNDQCPDHVAIYIGNGQQILHHVGGKLSSRDLYNDFYIKKTVRRYRHHEEN